MIRRAFTVLYVNDDFFYWFIYVHCPKSVKNFRVYTQNVTVTKCLCTEYFVGNPQKVLCLSTKIFVICNTVSVRAFCSLKNFWVRTQNFLWIVILVLATRIAAQKILCLSTKIFVIRNTGSGHQEIAAQKILCLSTKIFVKSTFFCEKDILQEWWFELLNI